MQLCIKERASAHDEERAQRIFIGTRYAEQGTIYRVVDASRDRQDRLLLVSVKEDAMVGDFIDEILVEQAFLGVEEKQEDELLTVREVAEALRVNETTVRRWLNCGIMACVFLPTDGQYKSYRIKRSTLEQILAGRA